MLIPDAQLAQALEPATTDWHSQPPRRDAAVLAPLFTEGGVDHLLLTRRHDDLKSHAGEVSFPGGAREGDEDALACALRESHEEIGLAPSSVQVLGRLPERGSIAGYHVHVFVGRIPSTRDLVIDPTEVQHLLSIPIAELLREERWEWRAREHQGRRYRIPFFPHEDDLLWGLTGRLTLDLLERLDASARRWTRR